QPYHGRKERVLAGILWIDIPAQPVGISQAIGPDLFAGARDGDKRIVVGDAIPAVVTDIARIFVLVEIGNDAQDFSHQVVHALGILADRRVGRLTRSAVAASNV